LEEFLRRQESRSLSDKEVGDTVEIILDLLAIYGAMTLIKDLWRKE
jgi:hypothetical protein